MSPRVGTEDQRFSWEVLVPQGLCLGFSLLEANNNRCVEVGSSSRPSIVHTLSVDCDYGYFKVNSQTTY